MSFVLLNINGHCKAKNYHLTDTNSIFLLKSQTPPLTYTENQSQHWHICLNRHQQNSVEEKRNQDILYEGKEIL